MRTQQKYQPNQQQYQYTPLTPNPHRLKSNPKYQYYRKNNPSKIRQSLTNQLTWSKQKKDKLQHLIRQNNELRKEIVQLKINQFYHFDDKKLKDLFLEIDTLKKQIKKYKENIYQLQLQNEFLKRSNNHLKMQLQKDIIENKKRQNLSIDSTKCTNKHQYNNNKNQESIVQLTTFSTHFLNHLEDDYQHFKTGDKISPKKNNFQNKIKMEKNKSPYNKSKRQISAEQPNQYLLYRRRQKIKSPTH